MHRPDVLDALRADDPLASSPPPPVDPAVLLERILATPLPPRPARRRGHRTLVLAAAGGVALVCAGAGWAVHDGLLGSDDVERELADGRAGLPLPEGATWPAVTFDEDSAYGQQLGRVTALMQASCAWEREWDQAYRAGDGAAQATAVGSLRDLLARTPLHREGEPEEAGGFDQASIDYRRALINAAAAGDPAGLRQDLAANC